MKRRILNIICTLFLVILFGQLFLVSSYATETATTDITMVVNSSCYVYSKQSATTSARSAYVTFGQELEVKEYGSKWSTISYNGDTLYILSSNLRYDTMTVVKNRVLVSPGAYATSVANSKGYVLYGTKVTVVGTKTSKGVTYLHCLISETYDETGEVVVATDVEGYINMDYLDESSTPKVVNSGTWVYSSAYGASSDESAKIHAGYLLTGCEVEMLMTNGTWSKIRYDGKIYYISADKLSPKTLQVMVNRVAQTVDAKPGSGWQHYIYWNTEITVLDTYESENYGTYYYCKIDGDYGFVRECSSSGLQYVGYNTQKITIGNVNVRRDAYSDSYIVATLAADEVVTVKYDSGTWAKVQYNGTWWGCVLSSDLTYPEYTLSGSYYTTAYKLYKGNASGTMTDTVSLVARNDKYGYAYVIASNGKSYWVETSSLTANDTEGSVQYTTAATTTLHTSTSSSSSSISVPYMTELILYKAVSTGSTGTWYKVGYEDTIYYLWVDEGDSLLTETKSSFSYTGETIYQQEVIELALLIYNNWDTTYGDNDSTGVANSDGQYVFDCSGFASYVLETVMQKYVSLYDLSANLKTLYNTTSIYNQGYNNELTVETVSLSEIQAGDIIFFNIADESDSSSSGLSYTHCGIYLGNNEFIHCSHSFGGGVRIMPLTGIYADSIVTIQRYLPTEVMAADQTLYIKNPGSGTVAYIRAEASSSSEQLAKLYNGTAVTLKFYNNGNWAYVEYEDGKFGYIQISYLTS